MARSKRGGYVTAVSTTSWQQLTEYGSSYGFNHISVQNYTDGDIEVAWEEATEADILVKKDTSGMYDFIFGNSPIYVRNVSGTGGNVYFKVWTNPKL